MNSNGDDVNSFMLSCGGKKLTARSISLQFLQPLSLANKKFNLNVGYLQDLAGNVSCTTGNLTIVAFVEQNVRNDRNTPGSVASSRHSISSGARIYFSISRFSLLLFLQMLLR